MLCIEPMGESCLTCL